MNSFREWLRTNQGVGVLLTILLAGFLTYLWLSPWTHRKLQDGFTLGFFPIFGVVVLMLLNMIMIIDGRRKDTESQMRMMDLKALFICLLILFGCWSYFELTDRMGFLIVSPVFLLIYVYCLGMRPWTHAFGAGIAMTVIVYAVFRLLGVELPPGILPL